MALLTEDLLTRKANVAVRNDSRFTGSNTDNLMKAILSESVRAYNAARTYDIFLSHSYLDKTLVLGLKQLFEESGYSVYVDWIEDRQLDRSQVNRATADTLRSRMRSSRCLFFAVSGNSSTSKWMPWECGFMDARSQRVAICPVTKGRAVSFAGQEYLGLYPYLDYAKVEGSDEFAIWVTDPQDTKRYSSLKSWLETGQLKQR